MKHLPHKKTISDKKENRKINLSNVFLMGKGVKFGEQTTALWKRQSSVQ